MSRKELSQVSVFTALRTRRITQKEAATKLRLTVRQVRRNLEAFRRDGAGESPCTSSAARASNHRSPTSRRTQALAIIREKYPDFGPTFAAEKLAEIHGVTVDHESLRRWMIAEDLWRLHGGPVTAHVWRERKECRGEMTQADGSDHAWFPRTVVPAAPSWPSLMMRRARSSGRSS